MKSISYLSKSKAHKHAYGQKVILVASTAILLSNLFAGLSDWSVPGGVLKANQVLAANMESPSYEIQMSNLNITSGEKDSASYKVTDTVGQTFAGEFDSAGYTVQAGFQYLYTLPTFSFQISDLTIDLGELSAGSFSTASNDLIISTQSAGYTIYVAAAHKLRTVTQSAEIEFTNCDAGCSIGTAGEWITPTNAGFGYNATGDHAASDFLGSADYFRPFANLATPQIAQIVVTHNQLVTDDTTTVTYQASIEGSQEAGNYTTRLDFTAVPNY